MTCVDVLVVLTIEEYVSLSFLLAYGSLVENFWSFVPTLLSIWHFCLVLIYSHFWQK